MKSGSVDIVAVGAHPDDCEFCIGGTLAKLARSGIRVGIIDLTNAEPTPMNARYRSPDDFDPDFAEKRIREARKAAEILGVERLTLDLPNRKLFDTFEARCKLATVFRGWKPKIVITMYGRTPTTSPDHYQAQLITEGAVFYCRLSKWEKYFENFPVHKINSLLYFPARKTTFQPEDYSSFYVDITEVAEIKKKALLAYKSQFEDQGHLRFLVLTKDWNKQLGQRVGVEYAEILLSPTPLLVENFNYFLGRVDADCL